MKSILYKIINKMFIIIAIPAIIGNIYITLDNLKSKDIYKKTREITKITGIIISNKEEKEYYDKYIIKTENKEIKNKKYIIYIGKNKSNFEYGDKIEFNAEYLEPQGQRNYKGFNYKEYLKTKKIYGTFNVKEKVKLIDKNQANKIFTIINKMQNIIINNTKKIIPKTTAEVLLGLILGKKDGIDEEIAKSFRLSNMTHILSVSGMHTSYIILGFTYLIKYVPRRKIYILIIIFLILFMFLTNFTPSVIRAVIMAVATILAKLLYKKPDNMNFLCLSLLILLIYNPYLIKDIGLLLSFLGTYGIILFSNKISLKLEKRLNKSVANILAVSCSAQILILPITIFNFNTISLSFLLSSFICTALVGVIIIYGFVNIIISLISSEIARKIALPLHLMLKALIKSSDIISNIDILNYIVSTPNIYIIIIYYAIVFITNYLLTIMLKEKQYLRKYEKDLLKKVKNINKIKLLAVLIGLIVVIFVSSNIQSFFVKDLSIYFIDVGQGDSTLVISPNGKNILIDTGEENKGLLSYILDRRIKRLDYILISHLDSDHVGGLEEILENIKVGTLIIGKQSNRTEELTKIIKKAETKNVKIKTVKKGDTIKLDEDVCIEILWPSNAKIIKENPINNNSVVAKLTYKKIGMLFTGDIEEIAEAEIIKHLDTGVDILKVAHHGSDTSSNVEFLKKVKPRIALIGVGKNNNFGHPNIKVIERLKNMKCKIYRTDISGEIIIKIDKQGNVNILENIRNNKFR